MITITAVKWAPPFAAGQVRDYRARWILEEVGWPYRVRLLDAPTMKAAGYRHLQPFGQVPALEEDGRPPLFESGAIVLDVAMRAGRCIAAEGTPERAAAVQWVIAGLNSVEPFVMDVAEVVYFMKDEAAKRAREPLVREQAIERLGELEAARGGRPYWVGDGFTVADLMIASILKSARRLATLPALAAWQDTMLARPAHVKAEADQRAEMARHGPQDMRYGEAAS